MSEFWVWNCEKCGATIRSGSNPNGDFRCVSCKTGLVLPVDNSHTHLGTLQDLISDIRIVNKLHNLGNAIYDVREREGEGWKGKKVTDYSNAVSRIMKIIGEQ